MGRREDLDRGKRRKDEGGLQRCRRLIQVLFFSRSKKKAAGRKLVHDATLVLMTCESLMRGGERSSKMDGRRYRWNQEAGRFD